MKIETLQVGAYEVNSSILVFDGKAWIVDPGAEAARIDEVMLKMSLEPAGILLTHAHFDHIGAIPELQRLHPGLPVYIGAKDVAAIGHPMNQFPPEYPPIPRPDNLFSEPGQFPLPPAMETIDTPGHTPGGVCYYFPEEKLLLSGDTLFAGSVGRTDFPGGDMVALMDSIGKLKRLPDDTVVIPGHGPTTTIGAEKTSNPFF